MIGLLPLPVIKRISALRWSDPVVRRLSGVGLRPLNSQDQVILKGAGKGLKFNPGGSNPGYALGTSEPFVQDALVHLVKPGMTVFDIGANVGFLSVILARLVGPGGKVVCFEPLPGNAEMIERNARSNGFSQLSVRREAAGGDRRPGAVPRRPRDGQQQAGERRPRERHVRRRGRGLRPPARHRLRRPRRGHPPDFVKIDAEGAEADVLAGASATLNSARPLLLIELHLTDAAVASALAPCATTRPCSRSRTPGPSTSSPPRPSVPTSSPRSKPPAGWPTRAESRRSRTRDKGQGTRARGTRTRNKGQETRHKGQTGDLPLRRRL